MAATMLTLHWPTLVTWPAALPLRLGTEGGVPSPYATTGKIVTGGTDSWYCCREKVLLWNSSRNRRRSRVGGSAMAPRASLSSAQDHCLSQGGSMYCEVCYQKWVELPGKAACRARISRVPRRGLQGLLPFVT